MRCVECQDAIGFGVRIPRPSHNNPHVACSAHTKHTAKTQQLIPNA